MFRVGLYARISTEDQPTLAMQNRAMREYAARRGWAVIMAFGAHEEFCRAPKCKVAM